MTIKKRCAYLLGGVAGAMLVTASIGAAQAAAPPDEVPVLENIIVPGLLFRDRSAAIAPTLEYGLEFFQPFEPLTVGDMLKRTPSTVFVSDILEFDGVRLRGLDPGYTQILINGKRVPGSDVDRSFWVDRIPAELIERVEIVRSASANRSGDAVAGALNIVMRDSYEFTGAYARAGGLYFSDDEWKPSYGGVISGALGPARGILGFNVQGRHNPKTKTSYRYEPDGGVLEFANREDQSDVRDGTDYSANGELAIPVGMGDFRLNGFYVYTDRTESEVSREYEHLTSVDIADLLVLTPQLEEIKQNNYTLAAALTQPFFGGESQFSLNLARFNEDIVQTEEETEYDPYPDVDDFGGTREFSDTNDEEWSARFEHRQPFFMADADIGVDYTDKQRSGRVAEAEIDAPGDPYPLAEPVEGGFYSIDESRLDPFVMFSRDTGMLAWEGGIRYETTKTSVIDRGTGERGRTEYQFVLPSANIRLNLTDADRMTFSGARTVRRPNFDLLAPTLLEEEPTEDTDFVGNPALKPESATGFDVGYERRLGMRGVGGVNFFYRSVTDVIELASTGEVSSSGEGFVFQPRNVGDGTVWGIEFDFSAPLTVIDLPNTGLFLNFAWLDSSITDPVTGVDRRFNEQAESVLNIGFIHDFPDFGAAFGASYRKQGAAFASFQGETVTTKYGGDLEAFVEKRFGERFVLRFTGTNLLDASKDETFHKWDNIPDQLSGDIDALDEFELESETAGPVFQLVGRYLF